jgi:hypothetical protein
MEYFQLFIWGCSKFPTLSQTLANPKPTLSQPLANP